MTSSFRHLIFAFSVSLTWIGQACSAADRQNVLLICVDDLKPQIGCYGDKIAKTPNIDALATKSVRFENAYCNQAVCSPSRNSLLSGLRPQTVGIYNLGTNFRAYDPDTVSLPQLFKNNGWRTEGVGKIFHFGHGNHEDPASWSVPHWHANVVSYGEGKEKKPEELTREEALFSNLPAANRPRGLAVKASDAEDNTYPDGLIAAEAIKRLQAASENNDQPFFLAVGFVKPHLPFVAPKKYWDLYDRSSLPLPEVRQAPEGAPPYAATNFGELRQYKGIPENGPISDELTRELIHGYYAATSYMDAQLGKVLAELDRLDLRKNTIIILWGDHGWHLGDHGMWCKHSNYEQATRIPVLVSVPGFATGATSSLLETVDIYPTLAELAGLTPPKNLDGHSFVSTLKDPKQPTKDHVISVYPRTPKDKGNILGRAIRTDRYRLVEWKAIGAPPETAEFELYDYVADPLETKNLAAARPETVSELRKILATHPEAKQPLTASGGNNRSQMFHQRDTNKDGKLSREEFLANQPDPKQAPARFNRFDTNKDDVLSHEEFVTQGKPKQP